MVTDVKNEFSALRRLTLATAFTLSGLAYAAANDLSKVTLRVADQAGQFQSKLKYAGLVDDTPYKIEWSVFPAAVNIHEALKAGAVDVGFAGSAPTVSAIAGGSPVKAVAGWDTGGRGVYLLVPENSPIKTVADLKGKTISPTGRGSAGHYITVLALKSAGLSVNDVKLAFLNPTDASAAFQTGAIDAWGIWGVWGIRAQGSAQRARVIIDTTTLRAEIYLASATPAALADPDKRAA
jgi:sulfonate transport system substrate-binding protein